MLPDQTPQEIAIRKAAETSPEYGSRFDERSIPELLTYGIINIDKPKGPTSHQISAYAQHILKIPKAGHAGTLDPGVTGCLPIALQRATRILQLLLLAGKEYVCVMHLHDDIDDTTIQETIMQFKGEIEQLPPKRSAVKRALRKRNIYTLDLLEIDGRDVLFSVKCQAGTYIRKLCHDIGERIGCGAHMAELRRTRSSFFDENSITTLQDLADAFYYYEDKHDETRLRELILPYEYALRNTPKIWVFDQTIDSLCNGANLAVVGISQCTNDIVPGEYVAVLSLKGELVALLKAKMTPEQIQTSPRGIAAESYKVFMYPNTYPKYTKESE
jgi:H/ACA ribonucleoprotein complex subunit 4